MTDSNNLIAGNSGHVGKLATYIAQQVIYGLCFLKLFVDFQKFLKA